MKGYELYVDGELILSGVTGNRIEQETGVKVNNNIAFYCSKPFTHEGKEYEIKKMQDEDTYKNCWNSHDTERWNKIREAADIIRSGGHIITKYKNGKYIHHVEAKR